ncbi:MAG: asparagine synthase (glutamine-hydrolyzing) [Acidobacteriota bacterium]
MCGFIGVVGGQVADPLGLIASIGHRGPDDCGYYSDGDVFLGHARLSILDLSSKGRQPMTDADGGVRIVFNGEIYNFLSLRKELQARGVRFKSNTDTETLIYLYKELGVGFFHRLNGMFALAIHDTVNRRVVLARDRFGKKPLYYCMDKGKLVFASEIKAILKALDRKPGLNITALRQYLAYLAPLPPHTFFEGVWKLEAGHRLIYENGAIKAVEQYYDPLTSPPVAVMDREEALEAVRRTLFDAVRSRLVSDVEVGVLLSGGLDSSLISAIYKEVSSRRLHTFSIGYEEHRNRYDELDFARITASHLGLEHHPLIASRKDFVRVLEDVVFHLDEPINDPAAVPTFLLAEWINSHGVKVCLSGEGSDELFLGYSLYEAVRPFYGLGPVGGGDYVLPSGGMQKEAYRRRAASGREVYRSIGEFFGLDDHGKNYLLSGGADENESWDYVRKHFDAFMKWSDRFSPGAYDPTKWCSYIDLKVWIAEVLMMKVDKMSMAHGLEVRAPFLDRDLVELALAIPTPLLMDKALLRAIAADCLPDSIVARRKKGFSSPFLEWLYDEYGDDILSAVRKVNRQLGLFRDDALEYYFNEGRQGNCKHVIWGLYVFARWCDVYDLV